jgi:squalene-associated FAD-dependent desaturase
MRTSEPRVAIVGGGLAGLAAATALSSVGVKARLFERRRQLGGRAGSYWDATADQWVDHCQHVSMGCCANYADFCRRMGTDHSFRRHATVHFIGLDGRTSALRASRLPAPLHLAPALWGMKFLTPRERLMIAAALRRLALPGSAPPPNITIGQWLAANGQSEDVIRRFWGVVLVSALSETIEHIAFAAARKVFVDGFMADPHGHVLEIPTVPLQELYEQVASRLTDQGVEIQTEAHVRRVCCGAARSTGIEVDGGETIESDAVIVAVPWRRLSDLLSDEQLTAIPNGAALRHLPSAPISSMHLWFDRPAIPVEHAVLIDRLSQWVFRRPTGAPEQPHAEESKHAQEHCQVVISASRDLASRDRAEILEQVMRDLQATWPESRNARLLHWRLITQQDAVLSPRPKVAELRPPQTTAISNLFLAGDWTRTGWPSTMEGAVRSGYLAAERLLESLDIPASFVKPEPRTWLTRRMLN